MRSHTLTVVTVALTCSLTSSLTAQTGVDPSGHWQGSVSSPRGEMRFELDLQKNDTGELAGTVDVPAQNIAGLPLREVIVQGRKIEFNARTDQAFRGDLAADGHAMAGTFTIEGNALPFTLARTGEARIRPVAKGTAIAKALEGEWQATLPSSGMRLQLKLSTDGDGSRAVLVNLDEGGLQLPAVWTQHDSSVVLDFPAVGGSFAATLNADATELTGTYSQAGKSVDLTFNRRR
jgi:hypothetical protein